MDLKHSVCLILCMCVPYVQFRACNLGWDSGVRIRSHSVTAESVSDVGIAETWAFTGLSDWYLSGPLSSFAYLELVPPVCWLTVLSSLCFITVHCSKIFICFVTYERSDRRVLGPAWLRKESQFIACLPVCCNSLVKFLSDLKDTAEERMLIGTFSGVLFTSYHLKPVPSFEHSVVFSMSVVLTRLQIYHRMSSILAPELVLDAMQSLGM